MSRPFVQIRTVAIFGICGMCASTAAARIVVHDELVVRAVAAHADPAILTRIARLLRPPIDRCSGRGRPPVYLYRTPPNRTLESINEDLRPLGFVAQPNFVYMPDWPVHPDQWPLENDGSGGGIADVDLNPEKVWAQLPAPKDPRVAVGVIDTGVAYNHPDLDEAVWVNQTELNGKPGVDDDGNGYVDDVHGFDATRVPSVVPDPADDVPAGDPYDETLGVGHGHGTAMAGIIAAEHNTSYVAGVAPGAKVVACKAFPSQHVGGCTTCDAVKCFAYLAALEDNAEDKKQLDVIAVNLSWGDQAAPTDSALEDAIASQRNHGVLVVASAGNDRADTDCHPHYPSSFTKANLIAVAETDNRDQPSDLSSWGRRSVHVFAPGLHVPVLTPVPLTPNEVVDLQGTSVATAHVSGLIALMRLVDVGGKSPSVRPWWALRNLVLAGGRGPLSPGQKHTATDRRILAWDPDQPGSRAGALTCSGQTVQARLQPRTGCSPANVPNALELSTGQVVPLLFANLDCAVAKGSVMVKITDKCAPDQTSEITLQDNGTAPDEVAGDGYYSGTWDPWNGSPWNTTDAGWRRAEIATYEVGGPPGVAIDTFTVCRGGTTCACK